MMHDEYGRQPDPEVLAKELDIYINWIEECLKEDGIRRDIELDMKAQITAAKTVRLNIERIYDE